jgi:alcohol dehydrogenase class IV
VNNHATVIDFPGPHKLGLWGDNLYPRWAVIDPDLHASVPWEVALSNGLDIISHVLDPLISSSDATETIRQQGMVMVEQVFRNMTALKANPADVRAREELALCAMQPLSAWFRTVTGAWPAHCISHTLGPVLGLPHGRVTGVVMYHLVRWTEERHTLHQTLTPRPPIPLTGYLKRQFADLGIIPKLAKPAGFDLGAVVENIFRNNNLNRGRLDHIVPISREEIGRLLAECFFGD